MFDINQNFKNPSVITWNIAVQRALWEKVTVDVAYVGLHGVDTAAQYNLNAPTSVIGGGTASEPLDILFGKTAGATLFWSGFSSSYNALQVKVNRHSATFNLTTAFTYGKAMDYQSGDDGGLALFYVDAARNYARADFDRTFTFVQSYVYSLPYGPGRSQLHGPLNYVVGGWSFSGILSLLSGTPMTVTASGSSLNTPGSTQTANQVAAVQILDGINVGNPWFSTGSFVQPTAVAFGNTGRNIFSGPGLFALNLSLFKSIQIRERYNIQVRAETFNLTNTPEFSNPNTSLTSSTYGYVTGTLGSGTGVNGTGGGRVLQLGLKILF